MGPWLTAALGGLCLAVLVGCQPRVDPGQFRCDPNVGDPCPPGWVCQIKGSTPEHRCYPESDAFCGNGVLDPGEQCDGGEYRYSDCTDYDLPAGFLYCLGNCTVHCTACGNGQVEWVSDTQREECDDGNTRDNDGCSSSCRFEVCGDAIQQAEEVCDDGNTDFGDGCSATCRSDERCGNGIIDYDVGEQCDDGNLRSRDGCSSGCTVELPTWEQHLNPLARGRYAHGMAYDPIRERVVLFGGYVDGLPVNDTWEYDGQRWARVHTPTSPPVRGFHSLAYDEAQGRVVLFGGMWATGHFYDDTWEYDGSDWYPVPTPNAPAARISFGLVYDALRARTVLCGGMVAGPDPPTMDTWEYDGSDWTEVITPQTPPRRTFPGIAYDRARQRVVLFGGCNPLDAWSDLSDTWAYDGGDWIRLQTTGGPAARCKTTLAYDESRDRVVLYGGYGVLSGLHDDTWELDGSVWAGPAAADATPAARTDHKMVYDAARERVVLFGGGGQMLDYADTWERVGTAWLEATPPTAPPARTGGGMVYALAHRRAVLFGGDGEHGPLADTWEHDGVEWIETTAAVAPEARSFHGMAYDEARDRVVLFGGRRNLERLGDTWEYDPVSRAWEKQLPEESPSARYGVGMAYNADTERVILFGGTSSTYENDTWEYDGTTWAPVDMLIKPGHRTGHALAYDRARRRLVLFSGWSSGGWLHDTWELRDGRWLEVVTATQPDPRASYGLEYNWHSGRVVMFGGHMGPGSSSETWELDGTRWLPVAPLATPPARTGVAMCYDPHRAVMIMDRDAASEATWEFHWASDHPVEACGSGVDDDEDTLAGCADPDCNLADACEPRERCNVAGDEDGDGLQDCADPNCGGFPCDDYGFVCRAGSCACPGGTVELGCDDQWDNDCDGLSDCEDPDCSEAATCQG